MNRATTKLYSDAVPERLRRECLDYAMAFGCAMCGMDVTEIPRHEYAIVNGERRPLLGLRAEADLVQLANEQLHDRYVVLCIACYKTLETEEGILRLVAAVN